MRRLVVAAFLVLVAAWIWALWEVHQREEELIDYHHQHVAPALAKMQNDRVSFDPANPRPLQLDHRELMRVLQEQLRLRARVNQASVWEANVRICIILAALLVAAGQWIRVFVFKRRYEQPDRPIATQAGMHIRRLTEIEECFVAKAGGRPGDERIEIDGRNAQVRFYNFSVVAKFVGNPRRRYVELKFEDILSGWVFQYREATLHLRTTAGRLVVRESVQPFDDLVHYLFDIAEFNRLDPVRYRAALAREPVIKVPWYGWAIIPAVILLIAGIIWSIL